MSHIKSELEKFEEVMLNLPVNDYRVTHEDLITSGKSMTFRGETIKQFLVASHLRLLERVVGIVDKITVTPQNKYNKEDLEKAQLINEYLLPAVKTKLINELKSIE